MKHVTRAALIVMIPLLGGCTGLAGLGGALMSTVGGGAVEAFQDKIEVRKAHRVERRRLMSIRIQQMVAEAGTRDFEGATVVWEEIFRIHDAGMPKWLFQELREGK